MTASIKKTLLLFLLFTFTLNAQKKETVYLKWKISDTLTYTTYMHGYSLEKRMKQIEKETNPEQQNKLLREIKTNIFNYETQIFSDNNGNYDVKIIQKFDIDKLNINDRNVILRGKFTPNGKILSFYYEQNKKNLISLFFELPKKPVKIGDEWNIDVNMISLNQHFKADSLFKKNTVKLKDIVMKNGNKIAIIEYNLSEYVSGSFEKNKSKRLKQNQDYEKPYLKAIHKIIGEFNLDKGFWVSYNGYRETKGNISIWGFNNNQKSVLKLKLKN